MLNKTQEIDQITITGNGIVLYREATTIEENGAVLTKTYHRSSLEPGNDLSQIPEKVASVCRLIWTDEVVQAFLQSTAVVNKMDEVKK